MTSKVCLECKIEKNINEFHKSKRGKFGVRSICKICRKNSIKEKKYRDNYLSKPEVKLVRYKYSKKYWGSRKEKFKELCKKYYLKDKKKKNEYSSIYQKTHRNEINANRRKRMKEDIKFYMKEKIRRQVYKRLKLYYKTGEIKQLSSYKIDIKKIIDHIGEYPKDGKIYHLDHIFPIKFFDLTNSKHIELCWHPHNLRWLEKEMNLSKKDKCNIEEFKKYLLCEPNSVFILYEEKTFQKLIKI